MINNSRRKIGETIAELIEQKDWNNTELANVMSPLVNISVLNIVYQISRIRIGYIYGASSKCETPDRQYQLHVLLWILNVHPRHNLIAEINKEKPALVENNGHIYPPDIGQRILEMELPYKFVVLTREDFQYFDSQLREQLGQNYRDIVEANSKKRQRLGKLTKNLTIFKGSYEKAYQQLSDNIDKKIRHYISIMTPNPSQS